MVSHVHADVIRRQKEGVNREEWRWPHPQPAWTLNLFAFSQGPAFPCPRILVRCLYSYSNPFLEAVWMGLYFLAVQTVRLGLGPYCCRLLDGVHSSWLTFKVNTRCWRLFWVFWATVEKHRYLIISLKLGADVLVFESVFLANSENEKRQGSWVFIYHLTARNQQGAFFILFNLSVEYLPFVYSSFQSTLDYSCPSRKH